MAWGTGPWTQRVGGLRALIAVTVSLLAACGHPASRADSPPPKIVVAGTSSLVDADYDIRVSGLPPESTVVVTLSSRDYLQEKWTSAIRVTASSNGTVDLGGAAPLPGGAYAGAHAMGLQDQLRPSSGCGGGCLFYPPTGSSTETLTVSTPGRVLATANIARTTSLPGEHLIHLASPDQPFQGSLFSPPLGGQPHSAVLLIGGSEGGEAFGGLAAALASHGHPVLAIAYFGLPGLPQHLSAIPLEYFLPALRYLQAAPGVDASRVFTMGVSRGSEAALLLAAHYRSLVRGAIGYVPSAVVNGAAESASVSAWTIDGRPLPFLPVTPAAVAVGPHGLVERGTFADALTNGPAEQAALIPVLGIRGPVFLAAGGDDQLWPSDRYAELIRRARPRSAANDVTLVYPQAGHALGLAEPDLATGTTSNADGTVLDLGGTVEADAQARRDAWPRLLAFLTG